MVKVKQFKKVLCLALCFAMLFGLLPATPYVFAEDVGTSESVSTPEDVPSVYSGEESEDGVSIIIANGEEPSEGEKSSEGEESPEGEGEQEQESEKPVVEETPKPVETVQPTEAPSTDATDSNENSTNENSTNEDTDEETTIDQPSEDELVEVSADDFSVMEGDDDSEAPVAIMLRGPAAMHRTSALNALIDQGGLSEENADAAIESLFMSMDEVKVKNVLRAGNELPSTLDGSTIEGISLKWVEEDSEEDGDDSVLYKILTSNADQTYKMQLNYALSGEHDYAAGDVVITVPTHMVMNRDGSIGDVLLIPYAEDPSRANDFNWKQIGDNYVLTSTKKMSAATKGYIQFAVSEITPHLVADNALSEPFSATIEVTTHAGNTIALGSNEIFLRIDTDVALTSLLKRVYPNAVIRVPKSSVPADCRVDDSEEQYVEVTWYITSSASGNTHFSLTYNDYLTDEYGGRIPNATGEEGTAVSGTLIDGWPGTSGSGATSISMPSQTVKSYYPASQFEPGVLYTFTNTVTYTLTETDNPTRVTTKTSTGTANFQWFEPSFESPTGHINLFVNGNDNEPRYVDGIENRTHYSAYAYEYGDIKLSSDGYYGNYPSALNALRNDSDQQISYTINTVAYVLPWTYVDDGTENSARKIGNYGQRNVLLTTTAGDYTPNILTGASLTGPLTLGSDFEYVAVDFTGSGPTAYKASFDNLNENGEWIDATAGNGSVSYSTDYDASSKPVINLEIMLNDEWVPYATADWTSGSLVIALASGGTQTYSYLELPEGTQNVRTKVDTNIAGLSYDLRTIINVKHSGVMKTLAEGAFTMATTPSIRVNLDATLKMDETVDSTAHEISKSGYDRLSGYTSDLSAYLVKSVSQSYADVDYDARRVKLHYSAYAHERSRIGSKTAYQQAVRDGAILEETSGTWYDLLPKGVYPDMESITLRSGDAIREAYTIENYNGSGRTLLVVSADLSSAITTYKDNMDYFYEDIPSIKFDAYYGFDDLKDYGDEIHNVIAFESDNAYLGNVETRMGEPDTPYGENNATTADAFADNEEKQAMVNLNPDNDNPSFIYAGASVKLEILSAARTSLSKDVQVNNDGIWDTGVDGVQMTVYTGGQYSYRLRMMSDDGTISKDLILYDSLENFVPTTGNSPEDIGAPCWKGTLRGVDVSQLEAAGCAPVVYYSTVSNLQLSDAINLDVANTANLNLADTSIWVPAASYSGPLSAVKAIAVDASKTTEGDDFILQPLTSAVVIVNMRAPGGDEALGYIAENAHAYNNVCLACTSIDASTMVSDEGNFVHKEYTRVGLRPMSIPVSKIWDDDNNRDALRTESVTVHLLRNGVDTGLTKVLDEEHEWAGVFENIAYADENGDKYRYTVTEDPVSGYTASVKLKGDGFVITNKHDPERINIPVTKTWVGDTAENRPAYITVALYANDERVSSLTIRPNSRGEWKGSFNNIYKYENGQEIVYRIEESIEGSLSDYIQTYDGYNITNTYNPFGTLIVSKSLLDATAAASAQSFPITFRFTKQQEGEDYDVLEQYQYDLINASTEEVVSNGTVGSNGTVAIQGGQKIVVKDIPKDVNYTVKEGSVAGFTLFDISGGLTGTIQSNKTSTVGLVNKYMAAGGFNAIAQKKLNNRVLKNYQFKFEMIDESTGEIVRTTFSGKPTSTEFDTDGETVLYSVADVTFGALHFTNFDDGKTYSYLIREANTNRQGYVYDESVYRMTLSIADNGDGTLTITPTYDQQVLTNAEAIEADPTVDPVYEYESLEKPLFENSYSSTGSVALRAWKTLKARPLQENEFSFTLLDNEGNAIETVGNTADGTVAFTPLNFTQADAGKTFYYFVCENKGSDAAVNYDDSKFGYSVQVIDNGDGSLQFVSSSVDASNRFIECNECHGTGEQAVASSEDASSEYSVLIGAATSNTDSAVKYVIKNLVCGENGIAKITSPVNDTIVLVSPTDTIEIVSYNSCATWYMTAGGYGYDISCGGDPNDSNSFTDGVWILEYADGTIDTLRTVFPFDANYLYDDNSHPNEIKYGGDLWWNPTIAAGWSTCDTIYFADHGAASITRATEGVGACDDCGGSGEVLNPNWEAESTDQLPVFTNTLKDGSLTIIKMIDPESGEYDESQLFTFQVELSNPDGTAVDSNITHEVTPYTPPEPAPSPSPEP